MKRILLACMLASGTLSAQKRLAHCHARDVTLRELDAGVANGGQLHYSFILTNHGNSACSVSGYPSATAFDAGGKLVPGVSFAQAPAIIAGPQHQRRRAIELKPGGHAWFQMVGNDGMGAEDLAPCRIVTRIRITLPGDRHPYPKFFGFSTCLGFNIPSISFLAPGVPE